MNLAPICLFTYNRLEETQKTIEALKKNYLSKKSELFIFSDGPKKDASLKEVEDVREYISSIDGFKNISIKNSLTNLGLANSIIHGTSSVLNNYKKVIVLEDDLVTSPNFLDFMNQALNYYESNDRIFSVSGYTLNLPSLEVCKKDYYYGYRASSWGWGIWNNRWQDIDWGVKDYLNFKYDFFEQIRFMRGGSDMPRMLHMQMKGRIDSWAIRWCYHQFKQNTYTVFPVKSKLISIGYGKYATHTKSEGQFSTLLDEGIKRDFNFNNDVTIDSKLLKEFRNKFSVKSRLLNFIYKKL